MAEDMVEGGSISALGVPVKTWYTVSKTSDDIVKKAKGDLVLVDIQYLGNQTIKDFLDSISNPKVNSLFISKDSNISKVICTDSSSSSSVASKRKDNKDNDCVYKYMKSYQNDDLKCYYTDYDSIMDTLVRKEIYAGSVTKMRRLPVISIYTNTAAIEFIQALASQTGNSIDQSNNTNFIIYSQEINKSSPKVYLIADLSKISHKESYTVDVNNMKLKKVVGEQSLIDYQNAFKSSEMVISGCNMIKLMDSIFS